MITADIKINDKLIYRLEGVRYPGTPKKGVNPYRIKLLDEKGNTVNEMLVAHQYEDGPVKLIQRMTQEICNSTNTKVK